MDRLARDGIVDEETTGRFRISALVEIVLSAEKLRELREWLRAQSDPASAGAAASVTVSDVFDDAEADEDEDDEESAL
ncbi:hypothetical protein D3C87_1978170 [compost metagenome]